MPTHCLSRPIERLLLLAILMVYLMLGTLYALKTPLWQAPDEPAHYNYVMHIATTGRLPVLALGDYPAAYLEEIKAARFAPTLSIDPIRYEAHQPPLYYLLAAGVVRATDWINLPAPLRLRLLSVALGAMGVLLCALVVARAFPGRPSLALGAAAFAATLPMHVAMTSAINSDVLVEVLVNLCALLVLGDRARAWGWRRTALLAVLLGLALLTKMQSYVALAVVGLALTCDAWQRRHGDGLRLLLTRGAMLVGGAGLIVLPWLLRNSSVYGAHDLLGLIRHDQVVTGQLTTRLFLAEHGWSALALAFVRTTFQSFWGQFGWMGVPLPPRIYLVLGLESGIAGLGLVVGLADRRRSQVAHDRDRQRSLLLFVAWSLVTLAGYLWWNTRFLQHQGRYLFPALTPLAAAFTYGLQRAWRVRTRWLMLAAGLSVAAIVGVGLALGDMPVFGVAAIAVAGMALWLAHPLDRRWPGLPLVALYGTQGLLALACLWLYIIPQLTP